MLFRSEDWKIVRNFRHNDPYYQPETGMYEIPRKDLYSCKRVISRVMSRLWNEPDYAIVELDRPMQGVEPVARIQRRLTADEGIFALGYPFGTALKYAHGQVRKDANVNTYVMAVDTFIGNSGSPVYDDREKKLVGLLSSGESDWVFDNQFGCNVTKVCQSGKCLGERVFKVSALEGIIRQLR